MLQLVRRKEPLSIFQEFPKPLPAAEGNNNVVSTALITVLSINVFVIASVGAFYLLLFFYQ
ncbi:MAG TPA: hypothetical protein VH369_23490 [Bryobacteraceae bacterium]